MVSGTKHSFARFIRWRREEPGSQDICLTLPTDEELRLVAYTEEDNNGKRPPNVGRLANEKMTMLRVEPVAGRHICTSVTQYA
jgi:hypothetical protein